MIYKTLGQSRPILNLASELGFKLCSDPVDAILRMCDSKIEQIMLQMPDCDSLDAMLDWVANKVKTNFEIIECDGDLGRIKKKYLQKREFGFLKLEELFADENDLGVTIKLINSEDWEPQFVSVIDCRGSKVMRAYFTKWHEIAHILTMPSNAPMFSFSHATASSGEPVERLMDLIAGRFGFHAKIVRQHIKDEISFEAIEHLRQQLCPQASYQSALISLAKFWTSPCILICAKLGLKKGEEAKLDQGSFFFFDNPKPELRAVHVTISDSARENRNFGIFKNMRVPADSIISKLYSDDKDYDESIEDLSWWESQGKRLPACKVRVRARRSNDLVNALITIKE